MRGIKKHILRTYLHKMLDSWMLLSFTQNFKGNWSNYCKALQIKQKKHNERENYTKNRKDLHQRTKHYAKLIFPAQDVSNVLMEFEVGYTAEFSVRFRVE